jgi:hypothetical protein
MSDKKQESLILKQQFNFEIYPDELGKMTWYESIVVVKNLGDGWRLPTILELHLIYNSELKDKFKIDNCYWSSSEINSEKAWIFNFNYGGIDYYGKYLYEYIRPVRDLII